MPKSPVGDLAKLAKEAAFYRIEYRDGLKATVAMANGVAAEFGFAFAQEERTGCHLVRAGRKQAPFGHFSHLLRAIDHAFHTGKPAYPVERTLVATGIFDAAMHSIAGGGKRLETPAPSV